MENLDLFTPLKDFKPILRKNTIVLEEGIAQFYIVLAFWNGENWIDTETKTMCLPSHVLDLSKLTTKQKAEEAIYKAYSMPNRPFDDYQIPDLDKLYESL